jgi:hypothetical protein
MYPWVTMPLQRSSIPCQINRYAMLEQATPIRDHFYSGLMEWPTVPGQRSIDVYN